MHSRTLTKTSLQKAGRGFSGRKKPWKLVSVATVETSAVFAKKKRTNNDRPSLANAWDIYVSNDYGFNGRAKVKFEQIVTYCSGDGKRVNGVLNFRIEDISYYHTSRDSAFSSLLIKGGQVYYTVKFDDLKAILDHSK